MNPELNMALEKIIQSAILSTRQFCVDNPKLSHKQKVGIFVTKIRTNIAYHSEWYYLSKQEQKKYSKHLFDTKFWIDIGVTKWRGLLD